MHSASQKSSMSLGEFTICKDSLGSHCEYAIDLLSNIEKIRLWHGADSCPKTQEGQTCTVCELCSANGLLGATKNALVTYIAAKEHLQEVQASLKKSVYIRGGPSRETLLKDNLAKAVFLCTATAGDTLRSQHATWQARLQSSEIVPPSSAQGPKHNHAGSGNTDKNRNGDILLPTYSGPRFVSPNNDSKLTAVSAGSVLGATATSSSSMFVVFKRCLSRDCPCEANGTSAASNTSSGGGFVARVAPKDPPLPSDSKKTHISKVTAKLGVATQASGNDATQSMITSNTPAKARMSVQTQKPSTYDDLTTPDARSLDAQGPQGVMLQEHEPSNPALELVWLTREAGLSLPPPELIVNPAVLRLRVQIARSDDTRRALMEWCRAWTVDLQLDLRERHGTGPEASLTRESTTKDTCGYPSALAHGLETIEPAKSPCKMDQVGETVADGASHGNGETAAQELGFNPKQEELKGQWQRAQKKRCKDRTRRAASGIVPC